MHGFSTKRRIEDNHSLIVSREMRDEVQKEIRIRVNQKGDIEGKEGKDSNKYPSLKFNNVI